MNLLESILLCIALYWAAIILGIYLSETLILPICDKIFPSKPNK